MRVILQNLPDHYGSEHESILNSEYKEKYGQFLVAQNSFFQTVHTLVTLSEDSFIERVICGSIIRIGSNPNITIDEINNKLSDKKLYLERVYPNSYNYLEHYIAREQSRTKSAIK